MSTMNLFSYLKSLEEEKEKNTVAVATKQVKSMFPLDIMRIIYQFDSTYKNEFTNCVEEMKWKFFIDDKIPAYYCTSSPYLNEIDTENPCPIYKEILRSIHPTVYDIKYYVDAKLNKIFPHLKRIGCKPEMFVDGTWHATNLEHIKSNIRTLRRIKYGYPGRLYWKMTVHVNLALSDSSLEMDQWIQDEMSQYYANYMEKEREKMENYQMMLESGEFYPELVPEEDEKSDYTVDSEGHSYRMNPKSSVWDGFNAYILQTPTCEIYTGLRMNAIYVAFHDIKIPID